MSEVVVGIYVACIVEVNKDGTKRLPQMTLSPQEKMNASMNANLSA